LSLSPDGLTAYLSSQRDGTGFDHIFVATRSATSDAFGTPALLPGIEGSDAGDDYSPRISIDGLRLYLTSDRTGDSHIYLAARTTIGVDFTVPQLLSSINSTTATIDKDEFLTPDEMTVYFASNRLTSVGTNIFVALGADAGTFNEPTEIPALTDPASYDILPVLAADQLTLYFGSTRAGGQGGTDIWMAVRSSVTAAFGTPQDVAELNTVNEDYPEWISSDGCTLYVASGPVNSMALYQAKRGN
jgi:Tol biopolymer transport system component